MNRNGHSGPRRLGAVDIGGTKIAVGIVGEAGTLEGRQECPTAAERGFDDAVGRMRAMLIELRGQGPLDGVGIGSTGPVDPVHGTIGEQGFVSAWKGRNLVSALESAVGVPVTLENDADAAALAEYHWGAGRGTARFIYVTVSTGIGTGLIIDGRLYRGVDGAHPEMGHHVIDPSGPACSCGAHGCWESLTTGPALAALVGAPDARTVCEAAEGGDPAATAAVARVARYLGVGIANLVTLFAPDAIAIGGGLMKSRHLFWDSIEETVRRHCGYVPHERTRIVPAAFGSEAALMGAAAGWLNRFPHA